MESCDAGGHAVSDHFGDVAKMVRLDNGPIREIDEFMLTRYACYLIAQNGDPRKPINHVGTQSRQWPRR